MRGAPRFIRDGTRLSEFLIIRSTSDAGRASANGLSITMSEYACRGIATLRRSMKILSGVFNVAETDKNCMSCRYVDHHQGNRSGYNFDARRYNDPNDIEHTYHCRRWPPIVTDIGGKRPGGSASASLNDFGWPQVRGFDWCGEYAMAQGHENEPTQT